MCEKILTFEELRNKKEERKGEGKEGREGGRKEGIKDQRVAGVQAEYSEHWSASQRRSTCRPSSLEEWLMKAGI